MGSLGMILKKGVFSLRSVEDGDQERRGRADLDEEAEGHGGDDAGGVSFRGRSEPGGVAEAGRCGKSEAGDDGDGG